MARGLYRVKDGWGGEDSAWVVYEDPSRLYELPASLYAAQGYQPPLPTLPVYDDTPSNA